VIKRAENRKAELNSLIAAIQGKFQNETELLIKLQRVAIDNDMSNGADTFNSELMFSAANTQLLLFDQRIDLGLLPNVAILSR